MDLMRADLISKYIDGEVVGREDYLVDSFASLSKAKSNQITFARTKKDTNAINDCEAGIVLVSKKDFGDYNKTVIYTDDAYVSLVKLVGFIYKTDSTNNTENKYVSVSPKAHIPKNVHIGCFTVIEDDVHVGQNSSIGNSCTIHAGVIIGDNCIIGSNTVIHSRTVIGSNSKISSGVVIGSNGFGFARHKNQWTQLTHIGGVDIGDNVYIGDNTTIDSGSFESTVIEDDVIIDNQVHIGHNVHVGRSTAIAGCTAIAGSTIIGSNCQFGGLCAINGHIKITDNVVIYGNSTVQEDINSPGHFSSCLQVLSNFSWKRSMLHFQGINKIVRRLIKVENSLESLSIKNK